MISSPKQHETGLNMTWAWLTSFFGWGLLAYSCIAAEGSAAQYMACALLAISSFYWAIHGGFSSLPRKERTLIYQAALTCLVVAGGIAGHVYWLGPLAPNWVATAICGLLLMECRVGHPNSIPSW